VSGKLVKISDVVAQHFRKCLAPRRASLRRAAFPDRTHYVTSSDDAQHGGASANFDVIGVANRTPMIDLAELDAHNFD
jgi:hypothetical protein